MNIRQHHTGMTEETLFLSIKFSFFLTTTWIQSAEWIYEFGITRLEQAFLRIFSLASMDYIERWLVLLFSRYSLHFYLLFSGNSCFTTLLTFHALEFSVSHLFSFFILRCYFFLCLRPEIPLTLTIPLPRPLFSSLRVPRSWSRNVFHLGFLWNIKSGLISLLLNQFSAILLLAFSKILIHKLFHSTRPLNIIGYDKYLWNISQILSFMESIIIAALMGSHHARYYSRSFLYGEIGCQLNFSRTIRDYSDMKSLRALHDQIVCCLGHIGDWYDIWYYCLLHQDKNPFTGLHANIILFLWIISLKIKIHMCDAVGSRNNSKVVKGSRSRADSTASFPVIME